MEIDGVALSKWNAHADKCGHCRSARDYAKPNLVCLNGHRMLQDLLRSLMLLETVRARSEAGEDLKGLMGSLPVPKVRELIEKGSET